MVRIAWIALSTIVMMQCEATQIFASENDDKPKTEIHQIDFGRDVAPILREKCIECHGPTMAMAELRLDRKQLAFESGESGGSIEPGSSEDSYLVQRLHDKDEGITMPPIGALSGNEIEMFRQWIDQGAKWPDHITLSRAQDSKRTNPQFQALFAVIRRADAKTVRQLLDADPLLVSMADRHGSTPLMYAALYADTDCVKLLLDRGAEPNRADDDGATALMWAARDVNKVRLLLDHGADVNARSNLGRTPLLIASAYAGNVASLQTLVAAGADRAAADGRRNDALLLAVATGDLAMVESLIEAGVDVQRTVERDGEPSWGAIVAAAFLNDLAMVRLFLEHGVQGPILNPALASAALNGSAEMVKLLLDAGADAGAMSKAEGEPGTALIAAAYTDYQNKEVMNLLLRHGADPTARDARDRTAFDYALRRGRTEVSEMFVQPQADTERSPRAAAAMGLALLQSCGTTFFRKSGCVACHQHSVTSIALEQARRTGVPVDDAAAVEQLKITAMVQAGRRTMFLQRAVTGGAGHTVGYLMLGMAAEGYPADEITDASAIELSGLQTADGSWFSHAHRPPTEYSRISATAVSARAMQLFAPPGLRDDMAPQVVKARHWLLGSEPTSNQESAFRLLGLKWTGAGAEDIQHSVDVLLTQQQSDGGWFQLPNMHTDAYATGLALYALHVAGGVSAGDPAYQRGVQFLLRSQHRDGSWHVHSRAYKFQPYFESGFPHQHDQWISGAATGWAATALMLSLDANSSLEE